MDGPIFTLLLVAMVSLKLATKCINKHPFDPITSYKNTILTGNACVLNAYSASLSTRVTMTNSSVLFLLLFLISATYVTSIKDLIYQNVDYVLINLVVS